VHHTTAAALVGLAARLTRRVFEDERRRACFWRVL
jgi:hypothetical protein